MRDGIPFDYVEELLSNPDNYELEIKRRLPIRGATGENHPNTSSELPSNRRLSYNGQNVKEDSSYQEIESFSDRNPTEISNRTLLVNALESTTKTDWEKKKLQEYKDKIADIEATEQKLLDTKKHIYEMSFATGPRDDAYKAKLRKHREDALHAQKRLDILDKQLLRIEAMKPIADILKREKANVKSKERNKYNTQLANKGKRLQLRWNSGYRRCVRRLLGKF